MDDRHPTTAHDEIVSNDNASDPGDEAKAYRRFGPMIVAMWSCTWPAAAA